MLSFNKILLVDDMMLSDNKLSFENMLPDNKTLSDNILSDNMMLYDNMLTYFFYWKLHALDQLAVVQRNCTGITLSEQRNAFQLLTGLKYRNLLDAKL
jgi:hypothetical protein